MKILILGGTSNTKADKLSKQLIDGCRKKGVEVEIITANIFTSDLKAIEQKEKPDVIVLVGTKKLDTTLPVINGLPLVYPWMGADKVIDEVVKYNK
ncbi:hypothetical protein D2962_05135 [Biomaibacter acetigenes]|jgi:D-hexose-6-phosphate mutarotase|uniref:Phosphotransferase system EIIB component type 2/3 domain-containing protein n=1 Tax=Biomaibacter acetigenes TaxID=2316383 RepID=A0A3G2R5B3_9FIRM|nr:hypothetical protein [Biomaibacter acetigenes]AYO30077.1 hypothetical protein D2962_05135 [Biomaibacter acetigenes]